MLILIIEKGRLIGHVLYYLYIYTFSDHKLNILRKKKKSIWSARALLVSAVPKPTNMNNNIIEAQLPLNIFLK